VLVLVHLNGQLVAPERATVSIFDRGFLFGDGVYEGLRTTAGPSGAPVIIGDTEHEERFAAGLREARIPFDAARITGLTDELVRANGLVESFIYWQVTRGTPSGAAGPARPRVASRDTQPTVVGFATPVPAVSSYVTPELKRAAIRPDTRWLRGRLKSISLLGGVLAAYEADEQGADDAIMVRGGIATEGTATNLFLSIGGRIVTPSLDSAPMLAGVTRRLLIERDPSIVQRPVSEAELRAADEVMLVGTKTMVVSITHLDGKQVGNGAHPGPAARVLLRTLVEAVRDDVARTESARTRRAGVTHV
jgi:D-alanine transaminase